MKTIMKVCVILGLALALSPALMAGKPAKKDPHTYISMAREAMEAKEYKKVEKYLNKAKKLDPNLAETYRLLGDLHAKFNREWKAKKFYDKAENLEQMQASNSAKGDSNSK